MFYAIIRRRNAGGLIVELLYKVGRLSRCLADAMKLPVFSRGTGKKLSNRAEKLGWLHKKPCLFLQKAYL